MAQTDTQLPGVVDLQAALAQQELDVRLDHINEDWDASQTYHLLAPIVAPNADPTQDRVLGYEIFLDLLEEFNPAFHT